MNHRGQFLLIGVVAAALNCSAAPPAVAILPFDVSGAGQTGANRELSAALPDLIAACLSVAPQEIRIVDRTTINAAVAEQALALRGHTASTDATAAGRFSSADYLVRGSLMPSGDSLELRILVFEAATSVLLGTSSAPLNRHSFVTDVCASTPALIGLVNATGASVAVAQAPAPEREALLVEGLNAYYNGNFTAAAGTFLEVTMRWGNHPAGHRWLAAALEQAGFTSLAERQAELYEQRFPPATTPQRPAEE